MTPGDMLVRLAQLLDRLDIAYAIVGGQAVIQRGNPRLTLDVDAVIARDLSVIQQIVEAAQEFDFVPPLSDMTAFVRKTMVLVLNDRLSDSHVDLVFAFTPFEQELIARAEALLVAGYPVRVASAEDLLLQKMFASRVKDLEDVKGILLRQRGRLDLGYVRHWLPQLAEVADEPGIVEQFEEMVRRFYIPPERMAI